MQHKKKASRGEKILVAFIVLMWIFTLPISVPAFGDLYLYLHYDGYRKVEGVISGMGGGRRNWTRYQVVLGNATESVMSETKPIKKVGDKITVLLRDGGLNLCVQGRNMGAVEYCDGIRERSLRHFNLWFFFLFLPSLAGIPIFAHLQRTRRM